MEIIPIDTRTDAHTPTRTPAVAPLESLSLFASPRYSLLSARDGVVVLVMNRSEHGRTNFMEVSQGTVSKYFVNRNHTIKITSAIVLESVKYLKFRRIIFDGVLMEEMPRLLAAVHIISAIGCHLKEFDSRSIARADLRENPDVKIHYYSAMQVLTVDESLVSWHHVRPFPPLWYICYLRVHKSARPKRCEMPKQRNKLKYECSLCYYLKYCVEDTVYGCISYNYCYKCALTGAIPSFTHKILDNCVEFTRTTISLHDGRAIIDVSRSANLYELPKHIRKRIIKIGKARKLFPGFKNIYVQMLISAKVLVPRTLEPLVYKVDAN